MMTTERRKRALPCSSVSSSHPRHSVHYSMNRTTMTILLATLLTSTSTAFIATTTTSTSSLHHQSLDVSTSGLLLTINDRPSTAARRNRETLSSLVTRTFSSCRMATGSSSAVADVPTITTTKGRRRSPTQSVPMEDFEYSIIRSLKLEAKRRNVELRPTEQNHDKIALVSPDHDHHLPNHPTVNVVHDLDLNNLVGRHSTPSVIQIGPKTTNRQRSISADRLSKSSSASSSTLLHKRSTRKKTKMITDVRPRKKNKLIGTLSGYPTSRRMTLEEERDVTQKILIARQLVTVHDNLCDSAYDRPPTEEEWAESCNMSVAQLQNILSQGKDAQALLVTAHAGLVTSIAKKHYNAMKRSNGVTNNMGTMSLQDLVQEGQLGMLTAAEKFDPSRGFRFSTYATYWIRALILKSISDSGRVIRLPESVSSKLRKINKARKQMVLEIGRQPSDPELAHYMKMPIDKLRKIISKTRSVVSLESPIRYNSHKDATDGTTIADLIASSDLCPAEDAQRRHLQDDIRDVINKELGERERAVLVARFGLENGESLSASHTAQQLGLSKDQVLRIEAKALNKLRSPHRNYRLKDYVNLDSIDHRHHNSNRRHDDSEMSSSSSSSFHERLGELYSHGKADRQHSNDSIETSAGRTIKDTRNVRTPKNQCEKLWFF